MIVRISRYIRFVYALSGFVDVAKFEAAHENGCCNLCVLVELPADSDRVERASHHQIQ